MAGLQTLGIGYFGGEHAPAFAPIYPASEFSSLSAAWKVLVVVNRHSDVYVWRAEEESRDAIPAALSRRRGLPLRMRMDKSFTLARAIHRSSVSLVAAGWQHAVVVMNTADVYCCRFNHKFTPIGDPLPQTDLRLSKEVPPTHAWEPILQLAAHDIIAVSCGGSFVVAVSAQGVVWTWGVSKHGALGHGKLLDEREEPTTVEALRGQRVAKVACGWEHCLAVCRDHPSDVFCWGCGADGRLANSGSVDTLQPCHVGLDTILKEAVASQGSPPEVAKSIREIACGAHHSVVLGGAGAVVTCGSNTYGQLGCDLKAERSSREGTPSADHVGNSGQPQVSPSDPPVVVSGGPALVESTPPGQGGHRGSFDQDLEVRYCQGADLSTVASAELTPGLSAHKSALSEPQPPQPGSDSDTVELDAGIDFSAQSRGDSAGAGAAATDTVTPRSRSIDSSTTESAGTPPVAAREAWMMELSPQDEAMKRLHRRSEVGTGQRQERRRSHQQEGGQRSRPAQSGRSDRWKVLVRRPLDHIELDRTQTAAFVACGPFHTAVVLKHASVPNHPSSGAILLWGWNILREKDPPMRTPHRIPRFVGADVQGIVCGAHYLLVSMSQPVRTLLSFVEPLDEASNGLRSPPWDSESGTMGYRPVNLPPKSEGEARKHEKEVSEMQRSMRRRNDEAARLRAATRRKGDSRESRLQKHCQIWLTELLPQWAAGSQPSPKMIRHWKQGLPPKVREVVWPRAIGNVLRITPDLFRIKVAKAEEARRVNEARARDMVVLRETARPGQVEQDPSRESTIACIPLDLPRTFPTLAFFQEDGPLYNDCRTILEAYTFYRPDIGYVQGMSYIAALLLIYLPAYPAFVCLCNIMNSPSVLGLYRLEPAAIAQRHRIFLMLLGHHYPALRHHFDRIGLMPEMFLLEWFLTMYTKCLPLDLASLVWDLYLLESEAALYKVAVAILHLCSDKLLREDAEGCQAVLRDLPRHIVEEETFLNAVNSVTLPASVQKEVQKLELEFTAAGSDAYPISGAWSTAQSGTSAWSSLLDRVWRR
mmetsp:Transcript_33855/g.81953  ORF Transcript_33855/g.81953 Transcript_33855/m.81953 type:complete len:1045 (+) Transcript_33855:60-3194(+)